MCQQSKPTGEGLETSGPIMADCAEKRRNPISVRLEGCRVRAKSVCGPGVRSLARYGATALQRYSARASAWVDVVLLNVAPTAKR